MDDFATNKGQKPYFQTNSAYNLIDSFSKNRADEISLRVHHQRQQSTNFMEKPVNATAELLKSQEEKRASHEGPMALDKTLKIELDRLEEMQQAYATKTFSKFPELNSGQNKLHFNVLDQFSSVNQS